MYFVAADSMFLCLEPSFHKILTWTARVCIPQTMALVLLENRTSDELFASPFAALLAAFAFSLRTELVSDEELAEPVRDCRGLSCESSKLNL
jgi:hypothetical protein